MSGKLPIDRVREAEDAPRIHDEHRQRFSEKQAKLRDLASTPANAGEAPREAASTEGDDA